MQTINPLLLSTASILFALFFYLIYQKMKDEIDDFSWNSYFKKCDIYQGHSHWTKLKKRLLQVYSHLKGKTS